MKQKEEFVRHVRRTGTSLGVSIPLEVIKILDIKEEDIVRIRVEKIMKGGKN